MTTAFKLPLPPGYGPLVPLDVQRHAGLGLKQHKQYLWCAHVNAVFVSAVEMPRASLDYPLAFTRDPQSGEFAPVAIFGLQQKQNLFVDADGSWREHAYVPAYIRRYPFCIAHVASRDGSAARSLVCVQEDQLAPGTGAPLFDRHGKPTAAWKPILKELEVIEAERQRTRVLVRRLDALSLLAPFDAVAVVKGGGVRSRLQGLYRVNEKLLNEIPARDLRTMLRRGELRWVHAHLNSLDNFGRLLDLSLSTKKS